MLFLYNKNKKLNNLLKIKNKLFLIHIAQKDLKPGCGLKTAKPGIENTIIISPPNSDKFKDT
jgi:hypothetical protein